MDKESLELQQKLLDKLDEWYNSPEFGKSKYDMQKYNRARGMLQATHPKVLTEVLGITSVPDVPRDAMNVIRGMDLTTLKNLEIFQGLDDKVVGHHMSAFGAIRNALNKQSPERRLELLNRAIDSGYITGMDPTGIGPIRTSIHIPVAHEGDQSGKKPGYKITREWTNDDDLEEIWTDLERSLRQQKDSFFEANQYGSTQDLGMRLVVCLMVKISLIQQTTVGIMQWLFGNKQLRVLKNLQLKNYNRFLNSMLVILKKLKPKQNN